MKEKEKIIAVVLAITIGAYEACMPIHAQKAEGDHACMMEELSLRESSGIASSLDKEGPRIMDISEGDVIIDEDGDYTITGETTLHRIYVAEQVTANIIFDHAKLRSANGNMTIASKAKVLITLIGDNMIQANQDAKDINAVNIAEDAQLHFSDQSTGSIILHGSSNYYGGSAAVQGGNLYIHGGTITMIGGNKIMGSYGKSYDVKTITMTGGTMHCYQGVITSTTPGTFFAESTSIHCPLPIFTVDRTYDTFTVHLSNYKAAYGEVQYSLDEITWSTSPIFAGLREGTLYTVYVRYMGSDTYTQSDTALLQIKTYKDGNTLVKAPTNLTAAYGQLLSEIPLPQGWTWVSDDTAVSVGTQTYPARFDTTNVEADYLFANTEGYHADGHYVERNLSVDVHKKESTITITTDNINQTYDGQPIPVPSVDQTGSTNTVVFKWYRHHGNGWEAISAAPVDAGSYKVVAVVNGDDHYTEAQTEKRFEIRKAIPSFTLPNDIVIRQKETLASAKLPAGFRWKDMTQRADQLGTHTIKAIFTPSDTTNYQTTEVDIPVTVVPALTVINHVPRINAVNRTIKFAEAFDPLNGVTAFDFEDGDLSDKIEIIYNHVNPQKEGTYEITYKITDRQGASTTKTISVIVIKRGNNQQPDEPLKQVNNTYVSVNTGDMTNSIIRSAMSLIASVALLFTLFVINGNKKKNKRKI